MHTEYSNNEKVQQFLIDLLDTAPDQAELLLELRKIVFDQHPNVAERMMYGGIMFSLRENDMSGLFVYKNHISLEFSDGHLLNDPNKILEGKGKYRRHLKLSQNQDILDKNPTFFLAQIQ